MAGTYQAVLSRSWEEYRGSKLYTEISKNGAELCDYCEEGINYVDDSLWEEWRDSKRILERDPPIVKQDQQTSVIKLSKKLRT